MVEITKLEKQKNKDKLNLFINGEFYCGILREIAIINNFFVGKKLEKTELDAAILEGQSKQAFSKAADYLSVRPHTRQELKLKLVKKEFPVEAIQKALDKLQEYGYLDDEKFAQMFIEQNSKLSKKMIINKLAAKGIFAVTAQKYLQDVPIDQEMQAACNQVEKYLKNKDINDCRDKLYAFLFRKGFDFDTIKKAVKLVTKIDTED